ncbi:hypothetical protein LTR36_004712 [Oleoguttula mirabilis]|uniref:Uncharacterized protein n=1 Tax=Oleoguttula mirabilis TaxID=1507867 RepID=A0AAV9JGD9_9PEZI|nr:hypothetical protein LTR36_004712 [Oleoguttula mirabilis]
MADSTAPAAVEEQEQQVTFNVKSSNEAKHVVTLAASVTIGELKQKLSTPEYADLPPERQRLIYSGRVLKDHDTVGSCKIKDGNTVHLVRGAESNQRQTPANQGGASVPPGAGQPANNVPSNFATGTGAGNPLAQLTGARYAGFHGLPGADMFGADGGMGAPPNPDQMLRMLEDPNFAQQMNEAMNNPAVVDMLRNNPMIRDNPMARQAIDNPEFRRMMMNPDMIRMQMQMQRAMGGAEGGQGAFPMPGQTDTTTPSAGGAATGAAGTGAAPNQTNPAAAPAGNPFAALFPGAGAGAPGAGTQNPAQQNPFAGLFGGGQQQGGDQQNNPMAAMTQQLMQNPQMMQQMMGMLGGGAGGAGDGSLGAGLGGGLGGGAGAGGFNPWAAMGGMGAPEPPAQPADDRPPEVRYEDQLRQLNDMGFYEFERNVQALRRSGGSVQGAVEYLLSA